MDMRRLGAHEQCGTANGRPEPERDGYDGSDSIQRRRGDRRRLGDNLFRVYRLTIGGVLWSYGVAKFGRFAE